MLFLALTGLVLVRFARPRVGFVLGLGALMLAVQVMQVMMN